MVQTKLEFKSKKKDSPSPGKKKGKKKNPWSDSDDDNDGDSGSDDDFVSTPVARTVSRRAAAGLSFSDNFFNCTRREGVGVGKGKNKTFFLFQPS